MTEDTQETLSALGGCLCVIAVAIGLTWFVGHTLGARQESDQRVRQHVEAVINNHDLELPMSEDDWWHRDRVVRCRRCERSWWTTRTFGRVPTTCGEQP